MPSDSKFPEPWRYIRKALVFEDEERAEEASQLARMLERRRGEERRKVEEVAETHKEWISRNPEINAADILTLMKHTGFRKIPRAIQRSLEEALALPEEEQEAFSRAQKTSLGFLLWWRSLCASCSPEELDELLEETCLQLQKNDPTLTWEGFKEYCLPPGDHQAAWRSFLEKHRPEGPAEFTAAREALQKEPDLFEKAHRADQALEYGPFERFLARQRSAQGGRPAPAAEALSEKSAPLSPSEVIQDTWKNFVARGLSFWHSTHPQDAREEESERLYYEITEPYVIARGWCLLLDTRDPNRHHFALAREALAKENVTGEDTAAHELALALFRELKTALPSIGLEQARIEDNPHIPEEDGMLAFDARAVNYLEKKGKAGKLFADAIRQESRARWEAYTQTVQPTLPHLPPPPPSSLWRLWADLSLEICPIRFALVLAVVLWREVVRPLLEKGREKHQALCLPVLDTVIDVAFSKGRRIIKGEKNLELHSPKGQLLARVDPIPWLTLEDIEATQKAYDLLRSVNGHRVLRAQVTTAHRQYLAGEPRFNRIEIPGGWAEVSKWAGARIKDRNDIAQIIKAEASAWVQWPNGSWGNLLLLEVNKSWRGQHASVVMTVPDLLLPGVVNRLLPKDGTIERQRQRQLVPVVGLPPFCGRKNEWASQATFQLLLLAEFRAHAEELYLKGAVHLSRKDLERLADRAGLPKESLDSVIERWLSGKDAFLARKEGGYTLAATYQAALEFVLTAGQEIVGGRKGGAIRLAAKKKAVQRGTKPRKR